MGASEQRWAGIERIVDDKEHLYVYVSAVSAIIIPKRAFRDEEHIRAFLDEMARLRLAASGSLAPMPPA